MNLNFTSTKKLIGLLALAVFFVNTTLTAQEIWSEDFSNGIPAGWTNEDITSNLGEEVLFEHATDPDAVNVAALGNSELETFMAESASNGYIWANSDRGLSAAPGVNHTAQLTTTPIDCSGQEKVFFTFQALIGVYEEDANTNAILRVDNGEGWTEFELFPGLTTSERYSSNPHTAYVDISSVAANQANVRLQFQWFGGWEYFWAIDDIVVSSENPAPPVDLAVSSLLGEFYAIPASVVTPASQVVETNFLSDVANAGSEDQNNVNLNISIFEGNNTTPVYSADLDYGTIISATDVQNEPIPNGFTPDMEPAEYTGRYTVTSDDSAMDSNPDDNVQEFSFVVSEALFAKETGATRATRPAASNWTTGQEHSWSYGNCFYFPAGNGWFVDYVEFGLGSTENIIGQQVAVWLYEWVDANGDGDSQEEERDRLGFNVYDIDGTDGGDLIQLPLLNFDDQTFNIPLDDNKYYLVMLEYTAPDDQTDLSIQVSEEYDYSAMAFMSAPEGVDGLGNVTGLGVGIPRYAGFLGIAETEYSGLGFGRDIVPVVRLGIKNEVRTEELADNNLIDVFPNPVSDRLTTKLELENAAADLNIRIVDYNGRTILEENHQNVQNNQFSFDVTNWTNGAYFIHFTTEEGTKTKRFVVQH